MGYVTLSEIQPFINSGVYSALSETGVFAQVSAKADIIISNVLGIDIPTSSADAPNYITVPAAKIIQFLSIHLLQEISPEFYPLIKAEYTDALKELAAKKDGTPTDKSSSYTQSIGGLLEW